MKHYAVSRLGGQRPGFGTPPSKGAFLKLNVKLHDADSEYRDEFVMKISWSSDEDGYTSGVIIEGGKLDLGEIADVLKYLDTSIDAAGAGYYEDLFFDGGDGPSVTHHFSRS